MFTSDAISAINAVFNGVVNILSITVPGTSITFLAMSISIFATLFVIKLVQDFLGASAGFATRSIRGGNRGKERSHYEYKARQRNDD